MLSETGKQEHQQEQQEDPAQQARSDGNNSRGHGSRSHQRVLDEDVFQLPALLDEQVQPGAFAMPGPAGVRRSSSSSSRRSHDSTEEALVFYPVEARIVVERNEDEIRDEVRGEIRHEVRDELRNEVMSFLLRTNSQKWRKLICVVGVVVALLIAIVASVGAIVFRREGDSSNSSTVSDGNTIDPTSTRPTERPTLPTLSSETSTTQPTTQGPVPTPPTGKCFETTKELQDKVDEYLQNSGANTEVALTYGWPIGTWCVSNIQDFSQLLAYDRNPVAVSFNEDISSWDLSHAVLTKLMFQGEMLDHSFNQDVSGWNVSSVKDMSYMFYDAAVFNQALSSWDVSSVTDMSGMFAGASAFNQYLATWDVSRVTSTAWMFNAQAFDQALLAWNVSSVINMGGMFAYTDAFNRPLSSWEVSSVGNMNSMFEGATAFDQDVSFWDVSHVTDMTKMFFNAKSFSQNLCAWGSKLSKTTLVVDMFRGSACPEKSDPNLTANPPGPFCFECL